MRIMLADHHPQALWALKMMLQEQVEFQITGEASDADSLLSLVTADPPDLVLMDWELPGIFIEDLISDLHACKPRPIVMTMCNKPEYSNMILRAGADAFISKSDQPEWLLETLRKFDKRLRLKTKKGELGNG
jgi:DNA-binding NarL/FixJ family response regulator